MKLRFSPAATREVAAATFGGNRVVRGLRIPVELVLNLLAQGASHTEILDDYPDLVEEDTLACLAYGRDSLEPIEVGGD